MPGTKRVINIGTNPDDGTGDLLRDALNKVNLNFDDVWEYTSVNSNLNITGDSINGTTDVIINPADTGAFKVTGDTIINPDGGNYNFTINGDLHNNVLYVQASTGRIGVHNTSPTVTLDITGDTKVSGMTTANNLTVTGNTILGDSNTDTVTYNAKSATDFLPFSTTQNIGAPSNRWGYVYSTNLDVSGIITGTFTGSMTSTLTGDVNNTNVTTVNLNATGPSNLTDVNISGNLVVQGTTTTLETNDVLVNNQLTFEGATADDFETVVTVTDPTQDNTITLKNASGTLAFESDVPTSVNDLTDVDISTNAPTNGQALVWDLANLKFIPGTVGGGGATDFVGLSDTPANFTGGASKFVKVNSAANALEFVADPGYLTSVPTGDIDTHLNTSTATANQVLSWDGADYDWVANAGGLGNVVDDTTPQLGGDLDVNGNQITSTSSLTINVNDYIILDADGGEVFFRDGTAGNYGSLLRNGANDLTISSGGSQAVIFSGANAAFQGDVSVSGTLTGYQTTAGLNTAIDSHLNQSNPTSGYVLTWNGTDYAWTANGTGGGIGDVVDDTTPQLGGTLDANGNTIDMGTNVITDAKVGQWDTSYGWGNHATAGYLTSFTETNDLSAAVTWANIPDGNVPASAVTQHQAALSVTKSQISDLATSDTDFGSNKITYSNHYANESDLPNASTYHGMFAHVHATAKGYFAHGGNWIKLLDETSSTTDNLSEGATNLYYTDARADTRATLRITAASITNLSDVDTVTAGDDGKILYYDHSSTSFKWKTDATGSSTFGLAGNTGTHTFDPSTETLTFLGTTGQINAGIAANNVTLELDSNINSITSIAFEGTTADANETKLQAIDPTADNTINLPNASGTISLEGDHPVHSFNVSNNGATDYVFSDDDNHWFPTSENDPILYLRRGDTYKFVVSAGASHPFEIRVGSGGSAYNTGVTNNGTGSGTITFKVPMSAPATLYYQCQNHSGMGNTINII